MWACGAAVPHVVRRVPPVAPAGRTRFAAGRQHARTTSHAHACPPQIRSRAARHKSRNSQWHSAARPRAAHRYHAICARVACGGAYGVCRLGCGGAAEYRDRELEAPVRPGITITGGRRPAGRLDERCTGSLRIRTWRARRRPLSRAPRWRPPPCAPPPGVRRAAIPAPDSLRAPRPCAHPLLKVCPGSPWRVLKHVVSVRRRDNARIVLGGPKEYPSAAGQCVERRGGRGVRRRDRPCPTCISGDSRADPCVCGGTSSH